MAKIYNYRSQLAVQRKQRLRSKLKMVALFVVVFTAIFATGMAVTWFPKSTQAEVAESSISVNFSMCSSFVRNNCVIDGDTIWLDRRKIRLADIDTPEKSEPQCAYEKQLADQATSRLLALLNEGPIEVQPISGRDIDKYGRDLRIIVRNGDSIGDQLVNEGLARPWVGYREPWC